jgi:serine/threonine-protein kinase
MPLASGAKLGRYEILGLIGKGGMGEVYRAHDPQLRRDVAIKISTEQFTERFEREALAIAALNHPHICTLHDVGPNYLVMEYIAGQPLKGPLPVEQALKYADQICQALDAAHSKEISHRDLKPGNILVTKIGVKVLDFGLARMASVSDASTLTHSGAVLGTPAYMAPEQWSGKPADARADIYAFGCILYEMLTGERAAGNRKSVEPPELERALKFCLAQDPEERWQSSRDLLLALEIIRLDLLDGSQNRPNRAFKLLPWLAATVVIVMAAAIAWWAPWHRPRSVTLAQPVFLGGVDLGGATAARSIGPDVVLSPDGTRVIIVAEGPNGESQLLTRLMDQSESQAAGLPGTEGAFAPFFSPDGQWVAFFVPGKLKKMRLDGTAPLTLCDAPEGRGGSWLDEDRIVAALDSQVGLSLIQAAGGPPIQLTELGPGENSHRWPYVLPGGKAVLFMSNRVFANFEESRIDAFLIDQYKRTNIFEHAGMYPRFLPSGHLAYITKGNLYAVPFDATSLRTYGNPVKLVDEVSNDATFGFVRLDVSTNGILLYRKGRSEGLRTVHWMKPTGELLALETNAAAYQCPRVSPDGSKVAWMKNQGSRADIWIRDLPGEKSLKLTDGGDVYTCPVWSPDGQYVVFNSAKGILWTRAGGGAPLQTLISGDLQFPGSFTLDGKLVYSQSKRFGGTIFTAQVLGLDSGQLRTDKPQQFLDTKCALSFPAFSPDGTLMAYDDGDSGGYEVYVRKFPDKGERWQISNHGGIMPVWSGNSHDLFYRTRDGQIMAVAYQLKNAVFKPENPRVWSEKWLANTGLTPNFALAPDGRFLVLMPAEAPASPQSHVTLVVNFFDEVRRRAPAGN